MEGPLEQHNLTLLPSTPAGHTKALASLDLWQVLCGTAVSNAPEAQANAC